MAARGRIPGPLGFQVILMAPGPVVNVKKTLKMPPPGNDTYYVHSFVTRPLTSDGKVTNWHGYAVLGIRGSNIALYDPHRKKLELSLTEFRSYFQAIFYGNP